MCNGANAMEMQQDHHDGVDLPPGFRFHPTDEELLSYYLTRKISNPRSAVRAIVEVDLNKCEPWDLPEKAKVGEKEWYLFSMRDRKYPTGMRTNRATEKGYWKATGKDREVMDSTTRAVVGMKKTLVFYGGRAPKGRKTNWIMHEYRLESGPSSSSALFHSAPPSLRSKQDEWVVCRVFQKIAGNKKPVLDADQTSHQLTHRDGDNSPNPTGTDSGDCDACTCQDSFGEGHTNHVAASLADATSVDLRQWRSVPVAAPLIGMHQNHIQCDPMTATVVVKPSPPDHPQSVVSHPYDRGYVRAKVEPFYATSCEGEDEAESSQRLSHLDYPWPGDVLYDHDFPPLNPGDSGQVYNRAVRSFSGLSEIDGLQECMWAY